MENNNFDNTEVIDIEFLEGVVENDIEFKRELLEIFLENANNNLIKLQKAVEENDNSGWHMTSHAFKGSAASIGAFSLAKLLEYCQKNPEVPKQEKVELLREIRAKNDLVVEFIKKEQEKV